MTNYDGVSFLIKLLLYGYFSICVQSEDSLIINQNITLQQGKIVENVFANIVLPNYDPCKIWPFNLICDHSKSCENEIQVLGNYADDFDTPKKRDSNINSKEDLITMTSTETEIPEDTRHLMEKSHVDMDISNTTFCKDGSSKFLNCNAKGKLEADQCCKNYNINMNYFVADVDSCDVYYQCAHFNSVQSRCPTGLHFNKALCLCDWPSSANCNYSNNFGKYISTTEKLDIAALLQINDPVEENTKFLTDYTEASVITDEFTTVIKRDSLKGSVSLLSNTPLIPCVVTNQESADKCCGSASTIFLEKIHIQHNTICYGYYTCEFGVATYKTCPPGSYFDETISACNSDALSDCKNPQKFYDTTNFSVNSFHENVAIQVDSIDECTSSTLCADGLSRLLLCNTTDKTRADECCRNAGGGINEYILDSTSCGNYYQCTNLNAEKKSCPSNLHFSAKKCVCDWPSSANCTESSTIEQKGVIRSLLEQQRGQILLPCKVTDEIGASACCRQFYRENMGLLIADNDDCSIFYQCSPTGAERKECPTGLHYNKKKLTCDWPNPDNCVQLQGVLSIMPVSGLLQSDTSNSRVWTSQLLTCKATDISEASTCCKNVSKNINYYIADSSNCSRFYQCTNSVASMVSCSTGLHFSRSSLVCVYPNSAKCVVALRSNFDIDIETQGTYVNDFVTAPSVRRRSALLFCDMTNDTTLNECCKNEKLGNDYYIQDSTNCSYFYQCAHGTVVKKYCGSNLYFNPKTFLCDWPKYVNCTRTRSALSNFNCEGTGRNFSHSLETVHIGSSSMNTDGLTVTPRAISFDRTLSVSNAPPEKRQAAAIPSNDEFLPENEFCGEVTQENVEYCCKIPENNGKYFSDSANCSQYFQCDISGRFLLMACPNGLQFNNDLMNCDWPNNVRCKIGNLIVSRIHDKDLGNHLTKNSLSELDTGIKLRKNYELEDSNIKYFIPNASLFLEDYDILGLEYNDESKLINENEPSDVLSIVPIAAKVKTSTIVMPASRKYKRPPTLSTTAAVKSNNFEICNTTTQAQADSCCLFKHNTNISDTANCSRYYKCYNGKAFLWLCENDFQFSIPSSSCVAPAKVNCVKETMKSMSATVTQKTSGANQKSTTKLTNLTLKPKRTRLLSSQIIDEMSVATNTVELSTLIPTKKHSICVAASSVEVSKCCEKGVEFVADETDCTRYYQCVWGVGLQFYCPAGTHFNKDLSVCDFPSAAGCM